VAPRPALADEIARLAALEPDVRVELSPSEAGTVISLAETGSFPIGTADLTPAAVRVLGRIAGLIRLESFEIRVEGHTDDRPIRTARYASNWELSAARATRVVQFFVEAGGVDPARLSAAGYGEFRPRRANDSAEARARNRRVDIVVFDGPPAQARASAVDYRDVGTRPPGGK
jgi:chemotaxis protein MotB